MTRDGATYTGTKGVEAWEKMGCTGSVPLVSVKDNSHWSEACLNTEVMTPYIRFGQPIHVSSITMGALQDLGYDVNISEQDDFSLENLGECGESCPALAARRSLLRGGSYDRSNESLASLPELSETADSILRYAAADRFRASATNKDTQADTSPDEEFIGNHVVSYIYQENGHFFSRTIFLENVDTLV